MTVNFFPYDFEVTNETFYTDSNALEMQTRVLNKRPTFNLSTNEPISANYYPINSALVARDADQNLSLVVTNDRSQGGSVLQNGLEFMQNRRLFKDDARGVGEPLSENGTFGEGISVQATYTVHFVNSTATYSKQRFQQLVIDDPLQYSFAFNYTLDASVALEEQPLISENVFSSVNAGQPVSAKVQVYPVERNVLLLRVENIGDLFDYPAGTNLSSTVVYVDLPQLAKDLYYKANGADSLLNGVNIYETQLTATESYLDMQKAKIKWSGLDDGQVTEPTFPKDLPNFVVSLTAQRIRQFYLQYIPVPSQNVVNSASTAKEQGQEEVVM